VSATLIPITFDKIMQTKTYTAIILKTPMKRFAIYADASVGARIQSSVVEAKKTRPHTHDMIDMVFRGLNVAMKQVTINDLKGSIYYARLVLEQKFENGIRHIVEVDARPSDCITLALINNVPVFCTQNVLDNALSFED